MIKKTLPPDQSPAKKHDDHAPIFKPVFAESWEQLPRVIKTHYQNRPYTKDRVTARGTLDIRCAGPIKILAPFFRLLGTVPFVNETSVPVTVHFDSMPESPAFHFDRIFHFKNRKPYHFRSRMVPINNHDVIEIMRFGLCWRIRYLWENNRVILRHRGYALRGFGCFMPLPLTFFLGRSEGAEWAIDENTFAMCATITHPWFGKIYEYRGRFSVA